MRCIAAIGSSIIVAGGLLISAPVVAQPGPSHSARDHHNPKATATIEQFMKIRAPNSPTLSEDGTLFVRDWPDGVNQLYRRDAGLPLDAPMKRLTDFKDGISRYSLSPNGKTIVFAAANGGNEQDQLYQLDVATSEITPLLVNPKVVYSLQTWLHDSSGFIYTANDGNPSDFYVYRFDLATKQSTKLLGRPGSWHVPDITNDGNRLLVGEFISASLSNAYELNVANASLNKLNFGTGPDAEGVFVPMGYLPDEKSAMISSDHEDGIRRLFVRDLTTGKISKPIPEMDRFEIEDGAINADRSLCALVCNEDGYATMRVVELPSFKTVKMPEIEKGIVGSVDIRGKTLTWTLSNTRTPGVAYAWTTDSAGEVRQLTQADTQGVDLAGFSLPKLITYKSFDGLEIPAFLYTPPGFTTGNPVPFVVNYHGGPEGQSRPGFSALTQYLLASGFGVMQPNVRGSTGYGRAFQMMDDYKKRWDSVKDGVEAARWLVKNGYSQTKKVAAYGGSYGGFMAVATVIEGADVFGASVDVVGIVNMKTFLEQTKDYRRKLREAEYGPLSDPAFLESISSINRIDEIKCPMLIAHGLNDPRVPVGEAMQLAVGLQKRGEDPELIFCPDEGHGFAKLENRLLFAKRMVKFLQRTIGS